MLVLRVIILAITSIHALALFAMNSSSVNTLTFSRSTQSNQIDLPSADCEGMLDNSKNWEITKIFSTMTVRTKAKNDHAGLLIINCPGLELIYHLNYNWKSGVAGRFTESNFAERNAGYDLYVSMDKPTSGGRSHTYGARVFDRSIDQLGLDLFFSNRSSQDRVMRGEVTHQLEQSSIGYGWDLTENLATKKIVTGKFARLRFFNMGLYAREQELVDEGGGNRTLYFSTPSPLGISYMYQDSSDEGIRHRMTRGFGAALGAVSLFSLLSLMQYELEDSITREIEWTARASWQIARRLTTSSSWQGRCPEETLPDCKVENASIDARFPWRRIIVQPTYSLLPHQALLDVAWEPSDQQSYGVSAQSGLGRTLLPAKLHQQEEIDQRDVSAFLTSMHSLNWHEVDYALNSTLPLANDQSYRYLSLAFSAGKNSLDSDWNLNASFRPFQASWFESIRLNYAAVLAENMATALAKISDKTIIGKLVTNVSGQGIAHADIVCDDASGKKQLTQSDEHGKFGCEFESGAAAVTVKAKKIGLEAVKTLEFEGFEISREMTLSLDTERQVDVLFFVDDGNRELSKADQRAPIKNFEPMAGGNIIQFQGGEGAGGELIIEYGKAYQVEINKALLPFEYELIRVYGGQIDARQMLNAEYKVEVLLQKK